MERFLKHIISYYFFSLFLVAGLSSSCNNPATLPKTTDSLLGIWSYCDTISGEAIYLILRDDNKVFYEYMYEPDSSGQHYNKYDSKEFVSFTLSGNSLIMTDKDNNSTTLIITDYNDSTIVFENTIEICHTICMKRIDRTPNIGIYEFNDSEDVVYNYTPGPYTIPDVSEKEPRLYPMTKRDMETARTLIKEFMEPTSFQKNYKQCFRERWGINNPDDRIEDSGTPLSFEKYNRAYISVYDGDDIVTFVTMVVKGRKNLQDPFILPTDGGNDFVEVYVSLKRKKILNFIVHGRA